MLKLPPALPPLDPPLSPFAPAPTPVNAILVAPAGTVNTPPALNVCDSAYAATGVTELDALDPFDLPKELFDATLNVCAVPFVSPVTTIGLDDPVAEATSVPPTNAVTVYESASNPFDDTLNATDACPFPPVTDVIEGTAGTRRLPDAVEPSNGTVGLQL